MTERAITSLHVLVIDPTEALADTLRDLPCQFSSSDLQQPYDLIIAHAPISEPVWEAIETHHAHTPVILVDPDERLTAPVAGRANIHRLTESSADALAALINALSSEAFHHGAPSVEQVLSRRSDELATLYAVSEAVSQPLDLEETMRTALDIIGQHTDFTDSVIVLSNPAEPSLEPVAWRGASQQYLDSFAQLSPRNYRWRVAQTGEPMFITDITAASARAGRDLRFGTGCVSSAVLPLVARGHTLGLLVLGSENPHSFPSEERALLMGIARAIATAIDTAQILAQQQQRADELALLSDIGLILQDTTNLEETTNRALARLQQTLRLDGAAVAQVDASNNHVVLLSAHGIPPPLDEAITAASARADFQALAGMFDEDDFCALSSLADYVQGTDSPVDLPPNTILTAYALRAHGAIQGVLLLLRAGAQPLSESEQNIVRLIGHRLAVALENARLYEEMRQRALEVTSLLATSEAVSSNLELNTRLEIITDRARRLIKADGAMLHLLQDDGETLQPVVVSHEQLRSAVYHLGEGLAGRVALRGQGEIVNDVPDNLDAIALPSGMDTPRSLLAVPLRVKEHVLGVMMLARIESRVPFSNSDLRLLYSLATQAAISVDNVRLFEENSRQRHLAESLSRVSRLTSATFDLDKVLDTILRELRSVIDFDSAHIRLIEGDEVRVAHHLGYPTNPPPKLLSMDLADLPTTRWIMRNHRYLVIPDTRKHDEWQPIEGTEYVRSWAGAPLSSRGRVIGILSVDSATPNIYNERHGAIVSAFANQIAATIDNTRLFQQTELRERESRTLYEVTRLLVSLNAQAIPSYVLDKLQDAIQYDVGMILIAEESHRLVAAVTRPINEGTFRALKSQLIAFYKDLSGTPVNARTVEASVISDYLVSSWVPPEEMHSRLVVPLMVANNLIGCIQLNSALPNAYDEDAERTLYTIATQTATALNTARLHENLQAGHHSLQQAYDELAEADRLKDELVQNVSHEIRTPLTFIKSYVELVLSGAMGEVSAKQRSALEIVARKTDDLKRLVDDIVSLKKIDTETLEIQPIDLAELARHSVEAFLPAAREAGLTVVAEIEPALPPTMGDHHRLGQVLDNLLGNARKFSPEGSTVTVRVMDRGPRLRVEVEDEGIGIASDKLEKVFERFYQVDGSSRRRYGGAGLGLAISKQIIEAHNGIIGVDSTVGKGSQFYFELYKARAHPETDPTPAPER